MKTKLLELYPSLTSPLASALEARMKQMVDGLQKKLADRADKEAKDITSILTELKKSIEAELKDPAYIQPSLFDDPEQERFERNKDAMRARAKEIPEEIKRETDAIRARFADPQARMFPVAVTFLVPERMARGYTTNRTNRTNEEGESMAEIIYKNEAYTIVGACFEVYNDKGCGFLEAVYQECLEIELGLRGLPFVPQADLQLTYKVRILKKTYQPDFCCFEKIILEIKAVSELIDEHRAQVHNYLKATGFRLGLLVNFGSKNKLEYERIVR